MIQVKLPTVWVHFTLSNCNWMSHTANRLSGKTGISSCSRSFIRRGSMWRNRKKLAKIRRNCAFCRLGVFLCVCVRILVWNNAQICSVSVQAGLSMWNSFIERKALLLLQYTSVNLWPPQAWISRVKILFITLWVRRIALQDGIMPNYDYYQTCIFLLSRICNKTSMSSCEFLWRSSRIVSQWTLCQIFKAIRISAW